MLPVATYAYNTVYHRIIRNSPYFLLHLRDPQIPYSVLEKAGKTFYNIDDYTQEMSLISKRVYERCAEFIEEGKEEMERYYKKTKLKTITVGDKSLFKTRPQPWRK